MKVHFISIGGSVMHQLAIALKKKGYEVTGSDDEIFEPAKTNLAELNLLPEQEGWFPAKITADIDAVILGMHAKNDNPELLKAQEIGLPIYSFPEYIFQESQDKTRVIVGGSHGKTTTTSMIMHVLKKAEKRFDYLVGARLEGFEQSVNITDAPVIVCEGDEYPASVIEKRPKFHFFFPHIAIITGIAWDHINVFPTFEFYLEQFKIFIDKIEPGGILIYNDSDNVLNDLVAEFNIENIDEEGVSEKARTQMLKLQSKKIQLQPYSIPHHRIQNGITSLMIEGNEAELKVFGDHNLMNINAAYYACKELGVDAKTFVEAISTFTGAAKRLELMAGASTVNVYRDFAHAPSKVKASIEAVKQQFPNRKLYAVLELHTYSSLNEAFMTEYRGAFEKADVGVVFYSKHALELKRMPDLPKEKVLEGFGKEGLLVMNDKSELWNFLQEQDFTNANLLLMSSGNYDGLDMNAFANKITAGS